MLVLGTILVQRRKGRDWRVGIQLGASRGWFLERQSDGTFRSYSYRATGTELVPHRPGDDWFDDDAPGGVREPRRPLPGAGGAAVALDPRDLD